MMDKINNSIRAADPNAFKASPVRKGKGVSNSAETQSPGFEAQLLQAGGMAPIAAGMMPQAQQSQVAMTGESGGEEKTSQKAGSSELASVSKEDSPTVSPQGTPVEKLANAQPSNGQFAMNPVAQQALVDSLRVTTQESAKSQLASSAEKSPLSLKSAASLNTANAIAGLQPWSKDWVFEGGPESMNSNLENSNPDLKPLFPIFDETQPKKAQGARQEVQEPTRTRGEAEGASAQTNLKAGSTAADQALAERFMSNAHDGLQAQLQALGGEVASMTEARPRGESRPVAGGNSNLSGGEFLTTLAAIRGATPEATREGNAQGQGQDGGFQQDRKSGMGPELRVIEGGSKGRKVGFEHDLMSARPETLSTMTGHSAHIATAAPAPMELTGHVTSGAMAQDRLSSESLTGLATGIRTLSSHANGQGGGEIRVRLNPENLGELHIRVMTSGNQVGLQIQASDEKAKKILEESMTHLKESMAANHLNLSQIDLTVGSSHQSAMNGDSRHGDQGQNSSHQQSFLGDLNQQSRGQNSWNGNGNSSSDRWSAGDSGTQPRGSVRSASSAQAAAFGGMATRSAPMSNGRIDVRA